MSRVSRSLAAQINELAAEVAYRENDRTIHPQLLDRMPPSKLQYTADTLKASINTLEWLQRNERLIRQRCPELFGGGV